MKNHEKESPKYVEEMECDFCHKKTMIFDGEDEAGHLNYYCDKCGEPNDD